MLSGTGWQDFPVKLIQSVLLRPAADFEHEREQEKMWITGCVSLRFPMIRKGCHFYVVQYKGMMYVILIGAFVKVEQKSRHHGDRYAVDSMNRCSSRH